MIATPEIDLGTMNFGTGTSGGESVAQRKLRVALERNAETAVFVDPTGFVHEMHVPSPVNGRPMEQGHAIVIWANGERVVSKPYKDQGYTMFKDWCDEQPELYVQYRQLMEARTRGVPVRVDKSKPEAMWPRKLMEHFERVAIGAADGKAYVPGEGIVDDPDGRKSLDEKLDSMQIDMERPKARKRTG